MKKRVIIADVDETVCKSCHKIDDEMAEQINQMIDAGFVFAFISGTKIEYLEKMLSCSLKGKHYLLGTTGTKCKIINPDKNDEDVYKQAFDEEDKEKIMQAFERLIAEYKIETLTTKEDQLQDRETQIVLSAIGRYAPFEKKNVYDPDGNKRREWVGFLKAILGLNTYEITIAGTTSVDVTQKGIDKGWGIKKFANHFGIDLNEILFLGDKTYPGGNDYAATKVVDSITVKGPEHTLEELKKL